MCRPVAWMLPAFPGVLTSRRDNREGWVRKVDTFAVEGLFQGFYRCILSIVYAHFYCVGPKQQREVDRGFAEVSERDRWLRVFQNTREPSDYLMCNSSNLIQIRIVAYADGQADPAVHGRAVIDNRTRIDVTVGDDHDAAVPGL